MHKTQMFIAGIGMTTSLGVNAITTSAAVTASISGYKLSHYDTQQGNPIIMANVSDEVFTNSSINLEKGTYYRDQYDHIIKMAALSLVDVFTAPGFDLESIKQPIPLVLAMPEPKTKLRQMTSKLLIKHMIELSGAPIDRNQIHCLHTGRAAGIEGLNLAYRYLDDLKHDYVLLGGSDSYQDLSLLDMLEQRLLVAGNGDGFAPGEGAGFLLLTRHPENALAYNGHHVTVNLPGIAEEQGHFYSEKAYQGNGLDLAFKQALKSHTNLPISRIYSSMNGENFWAKEYGVAYLRNKEHFVDNVIVEHPADCYGDLGVATGSVLIGLSAMQLLKSDEMNPHLVYSSSDLATRGAVLLEKGVIQ